MLKFFLLVSILLNTAVHAAPTPLTNPLKLPVWSDQERFQSNAVKMVPYTKEEFIAFAGFNYGFKNGYGLDANVCKKLSRYLCGGVRVFLGSLNNHALIRPATILETAPTTTEYQAILNGPSENWFAFVPEIGLTVNTQIIPLAEGRWSESAWFGFGKAYIGGRSGWAISFEPGVNQRFTQDGPFGWSLRAKYTFGWLHPLDNAGGTLPYDWFNFTAGLTYVW